MTDQALTSDALLAGLDPFARRARAPREAVDNARRHLAAVEGDIGAWERAHRALRDAESERIARVRDAQRVLAAAEAEFEVAQAELAQAAAAATGAAL